MHCNLRPPEPRQPFPALIMTPCQFDVAEPIHCRITERFAADILLCAVTLTAEPLTLTFDLKHLQRITCDVMKLCTKFECNRTIRGGVIAISVFDLMTLNML